MSDNPGFPIDVQQIRHETSFVVLPKHCNYQQPLIFGGALFSEMDLCAAVVAEKAVDHTPMVDNAVTHKVNDLVFKAPSFQGDLITLFGELDHFGQGTSLSIFVTAYRRARGDFNSDEPTLVAEAEFIFVTRSGDQYVNHGLQPMPR